MSRLSTSNYVPTPMANWLASLPSENVGTLFAKIYPPYAPFLAKWYRVEAWGQLCDGTDHRDLVHLMLYNKFPMHGKGWTYIAWRAEPDNPEQCKHALSGLVKDPKPYDGVAYN